MKKIGIITTSLAGFFLLAVPAFAQNTIGGCDPNDAICRMGLDTTIFGSIIGNIIQFIFVVAAILALGFLVYGGIKWLTSGGDKDGVASARGTIIAAIIGLLIIFLSYFILNFVLLFLTGNDFRSITVPRIGDNPQTQTINEQNSAQ